MHWRRMLPALAILPSALALCLAQDLPFSAPTDPAPAPNRIRVDKELVLVPVTVFDPFHRLVTGLAKNQFRVYDDAVEQTVSVFSMEDEPLALGFVFDVSGSMSGKLRRSRQAAVAFFQTANPADEFFLVEFNERPRLVVPLTSDARVIQTRLAAARSRGRTALFDAIHLAVGEIQKSAKPRKALLLISDGGDNSSRHTAADVRNLVRANDVLIYGIGIYGRGPIEDEVTGPGVLRDIAEQTGGREYRLDSLKDLPDIAARIGMELRNRYLLGFSPTDQQRDGRYHRVQVKVLPAHGLPPLRASWRLGYYAPRK